MQTADLVQYNNGFHKLTNVNSSDTRVRFCHSFFSLSIPQMLALLHMEPCNRAVEQAFGPQQSMLPAYVLDTRELVGMDDFCSFRCQDGYVLRGSLTSQVLECVELQDCTPPSTGPDTRKRIPHYAAQTCS